MQVNTYGLFDITCKSQSINNKRNTYIKSRLHCFFKWFNVAQFHVTQENGRTIHPCLTSFYEIYVFIDSFLLSYVY